MAEYELPDQDDVHLRHVGTTGPETDVKILITINGVKYRHYQVDAWSEIEHNETGQCCGLMFTQRD